MVYYIMPYIYIYIYIYGARAGVAGADAGREERRGAVVGDIATWADL